ncbi:MAG: IPT/TIG domain-containing protein [Pyrinomonadaceae bacterium]
MTQRIMADSDSYPFEDTGAATRNKTMGRTGEIRRVDPAFAVPGGEIVIDCAGLDTSDPSAFSVWIGDAQASVVALGPKRVLAIVPEVPTGGAVPLTLQLGTERSQPFTFTVAKKLFGDLHPVANPAFNPDDGALFVTRSGSRGEQLPVTIFRIDVNGELSDYSGDITNPTGIAFDPDGEMLVSSRLDGVVYRISGIGEAAPFARNLGIATGMAFSKSGLLFVGDRSGTIYQVNGIGEEKAWAEMDPSVSAYHLAFGPDGYLYVCGPTVTSFDCIWRISQNGEPEVFFKGLGRPQGLAFDVEGNLFVAASLRGRRGIVRISPVVKQAEIVVAGVNLIGLAFSSAGEMAIVSIDSVYSLPLGIKGILV